MAKDKSTAVQKVSVRGGGDAVYAFGIFGSLIYYLQVAEGFWAVIFAFVKAFIWPAFVVYDLLKFIH